MSSQDDTKYVQVTKNGAAISQALTNIWERFGKPEDFSSLAGKVLLKEIINVWKYFFHQEYQDIIKDHKIALDLEKDVSQMKEGYTPFAFPPTLFNLIRAVFPGVNLSSRKSQRVLQEIAPFLKTTNLKI